MLIRFRASNFRSIHETVELVLQGQRTRRSNVPGSSVAAIYGANASGKSNVLRALAFARNAALSSHRQWNPTGPPPRRTFALNESARSEPSLFEVDALVEGTRYQYGFALGPQVVEEEWLYAYPEGRRRLLFTRDDQEFDFGRGLKGSNRAIADLVRPNSLFLSAAAINNHEGVQPIYRWFDQMNFVGLATSDPSQNRLTIGMLDDDDRSDVERMLAVADLGITGVAVRHEEIDQAFATALKDLIASVVGDQEKIESIAPGNTQPMVEFKHMTASGETIDISLSNESRGTQMWFAHIGPVLTALRQGSVLVVDELDTSLHPRLSSEFIRLFDDPETNPRGAQLIFSTHDTTLLGNLVRHRLARDAVWFTEKDNTGATHLYPLTDFRPRSTEALERGYLQGRYGAVPIVDFRELADQLP